MRIPLLVLAAVLIPAGVAVNIRGSTKSVAMSQEALERFMPEYVGGSGALLGPDGKPLLNNWNPETRDALMASSMSGRKYSYYGNLFEVLVINSDRGESFHNPAACFATQDWNVTEQRTVTREFEGIGRVAFTFLDMNMVRGRRKVLFTYELGDRFIADQGRLVRTMFFEELKTARRQEVNMYRFIGETETVTEEELLDFAGAFLKTVRERRAAERS